MASRSASRLVCGLSRCVQQDETGSKDKKTVEIHSTRAENGHTQVCFCSRREEADMKMIRPVADAR